MSAIVFDDVELRLGKRLILSGASFSIPSGAFVGVLGPNGSGKTTLLRAMLGLIPATRGCISVLGSSPGRGNAAVGYMPQFRRAAAQLGFTGYDLVLGAIGGRSWGWPFSSARERRLAHAALAEVGATHLANRPICQLSGGERQRVLFAQALLEDPQLLLLDEPLMSLDPGHQRAIVEAVRRVARTRGSTVMFCSHDINPIIGAVDLVLYLGNGKAVLGPVDDVINADVLSRLYRTPINVVRSNGRLFILSSSGDFETRTFDLEDA